MLGIKERCKQNLLLKNRMGFQCRTLNPTRMEQIYIYTTRSDGKMIALHKCGLATFLYQLYLQKEPHECVYHLSMLIDPKVI